MKKIFTAFIVLIAYCCQNSVAQYAPVTDGSATSLLLTETRIDRPLTMHINQLQINGGYNFFLATNGYDYSGNLINYRDEGLASSMHSFSLNIRYGIFEFLEINFSGQYIKSIDRNRDLLILGTDLSQVTEMHEKKGMEDVSLGIALNPFSSHKAFDISIFGNIRLPSAKTEPSQPDNSIEITNGGSGFLIRNLNYHYYEVFGTGCAYTVAGLDAKLRFANAALSANISAGTALGSGNLSDWTQQLDGTVFTYFRNTYAARPQDLMSGSLNMDFQMYKWFDIYGGINYSKYVNGWKETGQIRYADPEMSSCYLHVGFEILTTPHLRILQSTQLGLFGKNTKAWNGFNISMSYNFFTSKK